MTPEESRMFMQVLAAKSKEYYRAWLTLGAVRQRYREVGDDRLDSLIDDLHRSPEYQREVTAWDSVIEERVPTSGETLLDSALVRLIEDYGLNRGKPN